MARTRIRGGTPTDYEPTQPTYAVTDPEILALIDSVNRQSRRNMEEHLRQAVEESRSEYSYQPPPNMLEPDPEDPSYCFPSPASSPRLQAQVPLTLAQPHLLPTASDLPLHLSTIQTTIEERQQLPEVHQDYSRLRAAETPPLPYSATTRATTEEKHQLQDHGPLPTTKSPPLPHPSVVGAIYEERQQLHEVHQDHSRLPTTESPPLPHSSTTGATIEEKQHIYELHQEDHRRLPTTESHPLSKSSTTNPTDDHYKRLQGETQAPAGPTHRSPLPAVSVPSVPRSIRSVAPRQRHPKGQQSTIITRSESSIPATKTHKVSEGMYSRPVPLVNERLFKLVVSNTRFRSSTGDRVHKAYKNSKPRKTGKHTST
ncbi:MAG: hypothetical protein LQ345_007132 [Seirophora villosa]|nr:MAG: hypothetical protein LQ345_007132 [Seirophora villosa]